MWKSEWDRGEILLNSEDYLNIFHEIKNSITLISSSLQLVEKKHFYLEGIGVQKNLEKAFYWTERAAQHGDRDAQFNLGWFYENGIVVPKDLKWAEGDV